jgi:hypothetical protein
MLQNGPLSNAHFYKTNYSLLLIKQIPDPTPVQVSCVSRCTLSNRTQKKIFGYYCEVPEANLHKKRVGFIDRSRYTPQALQKKHFATFYSYRNDRENISLQLGNKSEYVIMSHLT